MKLHENPELFRQAITATAQQKSTPEKSFSEIYVEKDYWVTVALKQIFQDAEAAGYTVFKGGTALSKCYGLIDRFSEDIDLAVSHNEDIADNQFTKRIKHVSRLVEEVMPEIFLEGVTNKKGNIRKTAHEYPITFEGDFGQVRDKVIVEASWLGNSDPFVQKEVSSYIYDMMVNTGQQELVAEYGLEPFTIKVLDIKRTFCEKIMSLVRFSYDDDPIDSLSKKIRHCYDLYFMLNDVEVKAFFESDDFLQMMAQVGQDDVESYVNRNEWLRNHPKDAKIFADLDNVWNQLKDTYTGDFSRLVLGVLPNESLIYDTMKTIKDRIESVPWDLKFEDKTK